MKTIKTLRLLKIFLFLLFITTIITSCEKEDPLAACKADPTCEYFRCKVDGKVWTPYCESAFLGCDAVDVQYYEETGYLIINAENQSGDIVLYVKGLFEINKEYGYFVGNNTKSTYSNFENGKKQIFPIDTTKLNHIYLTKLDKLNLTLEGTLSFSTMSIDHKEFTVTDGEFRLNYRF